MPTVSEHSELFDILFDKSTHVKKNILFVQGLAWPWTSKSYGCYWNPSTTLTQPWPTYIASEPSMTNRYPSSSHNCHTYQLHIGRHEGKWVVQGPLGPVHSTVRIQTYLSTGSKLVFQPILTIFLIRFRIL